MKRLSLLGVLLATLLCGAKADVDPNFHIYLCFGQSNMEGNAQPESVDKTGVDSRFRMLATTNFDNPKRTMGQWYTATPPIVSPIGGLGMADYFGRTMVAALPAECKVGVVDVAIGGCDIRMFDKDKYKTYAQKDDWSGQLARQYYGGNPYQRLIDMAKIAQESGVIKGILLHQGCTNNNDSNWPSMVKKIYNDILTDLGLGTDTIPLFVGETLREENGGACYAHNNQVARMPQFIHNSYVISSEGCPGNGQDPWHFNAVGYRIMGKRYGLKALEVMGREQKVDPDYNMNATLKKFYTAKSISIEKDIMVMPGQQQRIPVKATFQDGHSEDVSSEMEYNSTDVTFVNGLLAPNGAEDGFVDATFTDFMRNQTMEVIHVGVSYFPLKAANIQKLTGASFSFDEATHAFNMAANTQAGWLYDNPVDLSGYKYLVVKLKEPQDIGAEVRISSAKSINVVGYRDTINARTTVVVDLNNMVYSKTKVLSPTKISMVVFRTVKAGTIYVDDIFLTNDDSFAPTAIQAVNAAGEEPQAVYTLQGVKRDNEWERLPRGLYIVNGKKRMK